MKFTQSLRLTLVSTLASAALAQEEVVQSEEPGRLVNIFHDQNILYLKDSALAVPDGLACGELDSSTPVLFEEVAHRGDSVSSPRFQWILHENGDDRGGVVIESVQCPGKLVEVADSECNDERLVQLWRRKAMSNLVGNHNLNQVWFPRSRRSLLSYCPIPGSSDAPTATSTIAFENWICAGQFIQKEIPVRVHNDQRGGSPNAAGGHLRSAFSVVDV